MPEETAGGSVGADFRQMLQTINTAVALVDAETWAVTFENACFFRWFPARADSEDDTLLTRVEELDVDRAASRLESRSVAGRILICPACRQRLEHAFTFESRGAIEIKGVGMQVTFFVTGRKAA
jgi:hypothetical protein